MGPAQIPKADFIPETVMRLALLLCHGVYDRKSK